MSAILQSFGGTVRRSFVFSGRASRMEFLIFMVISQAPVALTDWLGGWFAPAPLQAALLFACNLLIIIPAPALVARRLHDVGLTARWGFILLAVAVLSLGFDLLGLLGGWNVRQPVESVLSYVDWVLFLPATVVYLLLLVVPARPGAARFGPDPRPQSKTADAEQSAPAV